MLSDIFSWSLLFYFLSFFPFFKKNLGVRSLELGRGDKERLVIEEMPGAWVGLLLRLPGKKQSQ